MSFSPRFSAISGCRFPLLGHSKIIYVMGTWVIDYGRMCVWDALTYVNSAGRSRCRAVGGKTLQS